MNDLRTAAQQALEALEFLSLDFMMLDLISPGREAGYKAITALRAALAEPVQEPVAWALLHSRGIEFSSRYPMQASKEAADQMARQHMGAVTVTPLYTAPPQRPAEPVQQGCDHCNHPLYAATKCRVCGRVTEPVQEPASKMTAGRAAYFMARFKREEKMLGPNEQAALDFVISMLEAALAEPPVDDPHRDHWIAIAEAAQKIAASKECGLMEAKALCAALDRLTDAALAEPVQDHLPDITKMVQEPVAWMYTGIKQDGTEHGPHLVWKPEYMDAMSASKGAKATPLYTAPPQRPAEPVQEPMPTRDEDEAQVLARLSKTPAEAYERGYMDGHLRGVERCARICDNIDVMSRDPMVCRGSAQECVEAIRETLAEPVAWLSTDCIGERYLCFTKPQDTDPVQPLFTAPPQRLPLTDEQKQAIHNETGAGHSLICLVESYINGIKE